MKIYDESLDNIVTQNYNRWNCIINCLLGITEYSYLKRKTHVLTQRRT